MAEYFQKNVFFSEAGMESCFFTFNAKTSQGTQQEHV